MSGADDATCMLGSTILDGQEVRVSPDTIGVMHVLREITGKEVRLEIVRRSALVNPGRELRSMRQCVACSTVYLEQIDEDGRLFLMEYRPRGGQLPD